MSKSGWSSCKRESLHGQTACKKLHVGTKRANTGQVELDRCRLFRSLHLRLPPQEQGLSQNRGLYQNLNLLVGKRRADAMKKVSRVASCKEMHRDKTVVMQGAVLTFMHWLSLL